MPHTKAMVRWMTKVQGRSVVTPPQARTELDATVEFQQCDPGHYIPNKQKALVLSSLRQPYELTAGHAVPTTRSDHELLVKVNFVGLNPIDWKAPDFGFGIPELPYVSGRELVGTIIQAPSSPNSRLHRGNVVIIPSTDYRDLRKAAFQEYSIASAFNVIRLPCGIPQEQGSILGVAFVAATLALGVCMGVNFIDIEDGPDLYQLLRSIDPERIPADIRLECLNGINDHERARSGDYVVVWGGSSTCAHTFKQIGRLAGLRIISVVDTAKHGLRISSQQQIRPDLLVDAHDPERAVHIIRAATGNRARFGFDTQGKDTAAHLVRSLSSKSTLLQDSSKLESFASRKLPTPPSTPHQTSSESRSHLVGLSGVPKTNIPEGLALHNIPMKLFHEIPEVGEALSAWCERLLVKGCLVPPDVVGTVNGLDGINEGLNMLRRREVSGGRLVAILP